MTVPDRTIHGSVLEFSPATLQNAKSHDTYHGKTVGASKRPRPRTKTEQYASSSRSLGRFLYAKMDSAKKMNKTKARGNELGTPIWPDNQPRAISSNKNVDGL